MDFFQKSNFFLWAFFTEIISESSFWILWKEKNDFKRKKLKFKKKAQKMDILKSG